MSYESIDLLFGGRGDMTGEQKKKVRDKLFFGYFLSATRLR